MQKKTPKAPGSSADNSQSNHLVEHLQKRFPENSSEEERTEAMQVIAAAIGGQYYAIYYIRMESHTYVCFNDRRADFLSAEGEQGDYEPALDYYIASYVVPEDQAAMREFTELSKVAQRLRDHCSVSRSYRQNEVGWTRGTFIAGKRDAEGNVTHVIFTVTDINAEIELEEKRLRAVYEAQHDPLTDLYNRNGLEEILTSDSLKTGRVGIAILDIDHFKSLNDRFGHGMGDRVLVSVAEQLTAAFYQGDVIARIGGDEFAILLRDCDSSAWEKLCMRLRTVHAALSNSFPNRPELSITLSVGLAFSECGVCPELYKLADEGLYETKRLGRAGCTLIGPEHQVLSHWKDERLSMFAKNVLEYNSTGICQIEISENEQEPRRLLCGETEKTLLGIPKVATPEESYAIWRDRIDPSYRDAMAQTERSMIECGQTECTFLWKHPEYGTIFLRCGGFGEKKSGKILLSGYCHPLVNTHIIEREDDQAQVLRALNDTFAASFYLNLENNIASAFKLGRASDYLDRDTASVSAFFDNFLTSIVDPRDREVMEAFADLTTLEERLKDEQFLDAEYRSRLVGSWCRARLLPVRYREDGTLTHVLFTVVALEFGKFKEVYTLDYNRRSLAALFDNLHCGIVMYEWRSGTLDLIHVSRYYEEHYSHRFVKLDADNTYRGNDDCVHPEDLNEYRIALARAMNETHELHHEYRVWDDKWGRYIWERADVILSQQQDGSCMIYAVYADITQRKEQELQLEKSHASLSAALNASNQLCYEYDPVLHTETCLTDENFFDLPKCIENYPDSLRDSDLIHPEDVETFIEAAHRMDGDADSSQCDVRVKKGECYIWYSCTFNGYYDSEKERKVAILSIVDISLRMASKQMYEERLRSLSAVTENTLCMTLLNLSKESYEVVECRDSVKSYVQTSLPLREYLTYAERGIVGEAKREAYRRLFNVDELLHQVALGHTHHELEYLLRITEHHHEWILSAIDLMQNPLTGEVTGVVYSRSQQTEKMNQLLLKRTLEQDYLFAAVIFVDTDEFYLYNPGQSAYSRCMQDYWRIALRGVHGHCSEETEQELRTLFVKEKILGYLSEQTEFSYACDGGIEDGTTHRLEIRFSYADDARTMLLASIRNITDTALLAKYRHDSEHDALTDLYNRKTTFRKCRELLDAHPHDPFVMVHVDIKRFRLYNTFFGDEAGDRLLCKVADILRELAADYEYWVYGRIEADVFAAFFPYDSERYHRHIKRAMGILQGYRTDFVIEPAIGMYFLTDRTMSIEAMFTRATLAAKLVQPSTPHATVFFDESMERELRSDHEILSEMQSAIDREQFQVYLQPKYSLRTNEPMGAEALVRWMHPQKGLIPPNRFIPIFEGNGFIAALDRYMWEHTCRLLSEWQNSGQPLLPISVNVSRISAYSQDTVPFLKALVQKYGIEPKYMELELTESAYVESPEQIRSRLIELQKFGFKILMDDFGSGYSSLNTLKDLPIDILKLDMKFLSEGDNERGSKILSSMVRMSKLLNLPVIAEGVETEMQAGYLRSIGCEYVQGYLYARPMPVAEYENTVLNQSDNRSRENVGQAQYSSVMDILLSDHGLAQLIDSTMPNPVILLEYHDRNFCCLRANQVCLREFGLQSDLRPASWIIREHLSERDYDRMLRAFEKCSETRKTIAFRLSWMNSDESIHRYLVYAIYEGYIGVEQVFAVAFIDEELQDYLEF